MEDFNIYRLHAVIEGRVQGVGFRYFVLERAESLGVCGWVRNNFNGNVEVLAEGPKEKLDNLLQSLRMGPPSAWVTQVITEWKSATGELHSFIIGKTT